MKNASPPGYFSKNHTENEVTVDKKGEELSRVYQRQARMKKLIFPENANRIA